MADPSPARTCRCRRASSTASAVMCAVLLLLAASGQRASGQAKRTAAALEFPPRLPDGRTVVTDRADEFLQPAGTIAKDVSIATTPPTVDFLYFPGQDYEGKPWSNWGDSLAVNGKYYASIGDHLAIGAKGDGTHGNGRALVYEYDPERKSIRQLVDTTKLLGLPDGHYTPGNIHGRLDLGSDGWLYFSTHRGSARATTDQYHYRGDWVLRCDPTSGTGEVVVHGPVPKHCIPTSVLDPQRLIFYGGTAAGSGADDEAGVHFFAYDLKNQKLLYSGPNGPSRYMILVASTGRVYYVSGKGDMTGPLMRFDPAVPGPPVQTRATLGLRAATQETPQGMVYTVSNGSGRQVAELYAMNTKSEEVEKLGPAAVGSANYITSLDADPTGRYLYYIPGAHGGSERDGAAVVQFDTRTRKKKVIAFLHPFYRDKYGATLVGTFSSAVDPKGDKLYVSWNVNRGGKAWVCEGSSLGLVWPACLFNRSWREGVGCGRVATYFQQVDEQPLLPGVGCQPVQRQLAKIEMRIAPIAIIILFAGALCPAQTKPARRPATITVAIFDFEATVLGNADLGKQSAEALGVLLGGQSGFQLVDRAQISKVLTEQELALTGLVRVGKLVGAQILVTGKVFALDKSMYVTAKLIGTETSLVEGVLVKAKARTDTRELLVELADKLQKRLADTAPKLLGNDMVAIDPLPALKDRLAKKSKPTVMIQVVERHIGEAQRAPDPPVDTELRSSFFACGFTVLDADETKAKADLLIKGEAFSEFAARIQNLRSCTARAELSVVNASDGKILASVRTTPRAADLSESIAGRTALQLAGRDGRCSCLRNSPRHCPTRSRGRHLDALDPRRTHAR